MKFENLLNIIPKVKKNTLPGASIQMQLSPKGRSPYEQNYKTPKTRQAGVMALLYPKNTETYLALILRTTYDGEHSGQVSFPGGKKELEDESLWETALREVNEEIGISPEKINYIKALTSIYVPISDFRVFPYLATLNESPKFELQEVEVAAIIQMPLSNLIETDNVENVKIEINNDELLKVPAFLFNEYKIWGATAMILNELKQLIRDSYFDV